MTEIDVSRRAYLKRFEAREKRTSVISLGGGACSVGGKLYPSREAAQEAEAEKPAKKHW